MKNKNRLGIIVLLIVSLFLTACSSGEVKRDSDKKLIVTTTTLLYDLVKTLAEDSVEIKYIMGPGVDPHGYSPSSGDVNLLNEADLVVYSGLHLEGKMEDVFQGLNKMGKVALEATSTIPRESLIMEDGGVDPHVWWDPTLWKYVTENVAHSLIKIMPENRESIEKNLKNYLGELDNLDAWSKKEVETIPKEQRVLITAHDAFSYFARQYGFEVKGIQGMNTNNEASASDVDNLATFIAEKNIKAIFVETSVPHRKIESLKEAVATKGKEVNIGGELYSDSLGDSKNNAETYIKTVKANINTIVKALNGGV